jgi:hypothetical protein
VSTDHSGGVPNEVPGWIFNITWRELKSNGDVRASDLHGPMLNVKRSSLVCAVFALLPGIMVTDSPLTLHLERA